MHRLTNSVIFVLIEAWQHHDPAKAEEIWTLIGRVYNANRSLFDLRGDARKTYAAELITAAWRGREYFLLEWHRQHPEQGPPPQKPMFITELEMKLAELRVSTKSEQSPTEQGVVNVKDLPQDQTFQGMANQPQQPVPTEFHNANIEDKGLRSALHIDFGSIPELNFDDMDWAFWDSINAEHQVNFTN